MTIIYAAALSFVALLLLGWIVKQILADNQHQRDLADVERIEGMFDAMTTVKRSPRLRFAESNPYAARTGDGDFWTPYSWQSVVAEQWQPKADVLQLPGHVTQEFRAIVARSYEGTVAA